MRQHFLKYGLLLSLGAIFLIGGKVQAQPCLGEEYAFAHKDNQALELIKLNLGLLTPQEAADTLSQYIFNKPEANEFDLNELLDWTKSHLPAAYYKAFIKALLEKPNPLFPKGETFGDPGFQKLERVIEFRTAAIKRAHEFPEFSPILNTQLTTYVSKFSPPYLHALEMDEFRELLIAVSANKETSSIGKQIIENTYTGPRSFQEETRKQIQGFMQQNWFQSKIMESLGQVPSEKKYVIKYLSSANLSLKTGALRGLASDPQNWSIIRPLLNDPEPSVQIAAIDSLKNDPEAWPDIASKLTSPDTQVRNRVVASYYASNQPFLNAYLRPLLRSAISTDSFQQLEGSFVLKRVREWNTQWPTMTKEEQKEIQSISQGLKEELSNISNDVILTILKQELAKIPQ